jgi:hypothetical protein
MKKLFTQAVLAACSLGVAAPAIAGNKDRSGQAGATELLINPWAQSSGLFGLDVSTVKGAQSMKINVAGLASTENLEIGAAHSWYLSGTGIAVNNAAAAYRLGESSVIGVNVMSMSFGDIAVTDIDHPEGTGAKYHPQFLNASIGFSKEFSKSIRGGIAGTFISEQISNITAVGGSIDAGIQYVTGKRDNLHIGVTLRNAGTNMRFSGGGFSSESLAPDDPYYSVTRNTPTEKFQLPTYMSLGLGYDFYLDGNTTDESARPNHRITAIGSFTSNSFNNDYLGLGAEYAFKERLMARVAYRYEKDIMDAEKSTTFFTGLACGLTLTQQIGKNGPTAAIDYSFRTTRRPDNGVHVFGVRFIFPAKKAAAAADDDK